MNSYKPFKAAPAAGSVPPLVEPAANNIGAASNRFCESGETVPNPTGGAGAPNLSTLSKPWGNQPICLGCNRGATYSCICDPFFEDEDSPEPRFDPDNGWGLAERAAYGMGVKL